MRHEPSVPRPVSRRSFGFIAAPPEPRQKPGNHASPIKSICKKIAVHTRKSGKINCFIQLLHPDELSLINNSLGVVHDRLYSGQLVVRYCGGVGLGIPPIMTSDSQRESITLLCNKAVKDCPACPFKARCVSPSRGTAIALAKSYAAGTMAQGHDRGSTSPCHRSGSRRYVEPFLHCRSR